MCRRGAPQRLPPTAGGRAGGGGPRRRRRRRSAWARRWRPRGLQNGREEVGAAPGGAGRLPLPAGRGTTCHERADRRRAVGAVGPHWPRRSHGGELPVAGGGGAPPPPILARHPPSASADQWRCRWAADRVTAAADATATKGHRTRQRVGRTRRPPAVGRRLAAVTGRPPLGLRRPWPPRQAAARRADAVRAGGSGSAAHPRAAGPRRRRQRWRRSAAWWSVAGGAAPRRTASAPRPCRQSAQRPPHGSGGQLPAPPRRWCRRCSLRRGRGSTAERNGKRL